MKFLRGVLFITSTLLVLVAAGFYTRPLDFYDSFTWLQQALHGVENRWVWVSGHRAHYEVEGPADGQPVVLIHGLGGRAENWRALAPYLARSGYRVYMPDLIGYGRSDQPKGFSYSIRDEAVFVVGFLDALGLKRVDLGGWSMGGWIAQVAAFLHPERVKRLMLFDSAGLNVVPDWDTRLFTPVNVDQLTQLNALLMPHPPIIPSFIALDILRASRDSNWVVSTAITQMFTAQDVTDAMLPRLSMPLLIEWGTQDRIVPVSQAQKMHELAPRSQLRLYAGCGHLAPLQCADQIGPDVVRYLQQTPLTTPPPEQPKVATKPVPPKPKRPGTPAHLQAASVLPSGTTGQN
jgi:pimeloyl-ACP methyl ester carboxylesterase